ncbi:unnamed protein product, partial [Medioppia subpectinata]
LWLMEYTVGVVPQISSLNVQCDRTGMRVAVNFDTPFNGIIFSKGHYADLGCRYLTPRSSRTSIAFFIPSTNCGTVQTSLRRDGSLGFKNVIIIQNDPEYQEVWDMARKISCDWVTRIDKYVTFAPFGVDVLNVKELTFPGDTVDCWMEIQRGGGPFAPPITGIVPIGQTITIVIYIKDRDSTFDVQVKDCYAYDSPQYNNPGVRAIQLTDTRGCVVKEKLIRGFYRTRDVRNSGATIIAYGVVNAFKFPEAMDVFLACNVEVCKGGCDNPCQPEVEVAGGEGGDDQSSARPFTTPSSVERPVEEESTTPTIDSTTESNTEDSDDDSDDKDSESESTGSDKHKTTTEKTTETDKEESDKDTEMEPNSNDKSSTTPPSESAANEDEEEDKSAALSIRVPTVVAKNPRPKPSNRRNNAKLNARQRPKQKSKTRNSSKTKKSQKLTTTSRTNRRIISPLEDIDDQDLHFWQKPTQQDNRKICFSALSLFVSSIALISLATLFTANNMYINGANNVLVRYVQPDQSATNAEFSIPVDKCGTKTQDIDGEDGTPPKRGFENIVVFQNDPTYQEVFDHARMIVCRYTLDDDFELKEKRVVFKPVVIDMLDVVSIPVREADGEQTRVDCWMEITKGRFPLTSPIDNAVKVGSPLTLAIFVRDPRKRTDLRVKDCYAYDDPQVAESNGPALLQLTDFDGCPTKPKLIEVWRRTHDAGPTGATIIAFTTVTVR